MAVDDMVFNIQAIEFVLEDYKNYINIHSYCDAESAIEYF